jgi:hypothetical protein
MPSTARFIRGPSPYSSGPIARRAKVISMASDDVCPDDVCPVVTIVSGLPRSGTSLMMQMIDTGGIPALTDASRKPDEDNPRGYFEFQPVKRTAQDSSWLDLAAGKVVKVVHLLLLDLPLDKRFQYRVVMMRRHSDEVIASQSKMLQRKGGKGSLLEAERLKTIYAGQMAKVEHHLQHNPQAFAVLNVCYNDLLNNVKREIERIDVFLGGGLDRSEMAAALDPALYRNRVTPFV